jgi:DNA-binding transcriptional LysR family regulator
MFERALQTWGIDLAQLNVALVLNSSEMVKAVVEGGIGAAALPELMVQKELQLETLNSIQVIDNRGDTPTILDIVQPIWKLKHQQRFETQIMVAFEQILESAVAIAS